MNTHVAQILLVEDNPGDARLIREAFQSARFFCHLHAVSDGEEALAFLHREGHFVEAPRPDLILLDLNLPHKDGREVLAEIKNEPSLRQIPVLILSSSAVEADIACAYDLHANGYIQKPANLEQLVQVVKSLEDFWFSIARLSSEDSA